MQPESEIPNQVTNGVKQGGILSLVLFIVYFDELITQLKSSGVRCSIKNNYSSLLVHLVSQMI